MIYLFFLLITIIEIRFFRNKSERVSTVLYIFSFLYLFLLFGLRYRVGGDTIASVDINYPMQPTLSEIEWSDFLISDMAPLYMILCTICKTISSDFTIMQLVNSLIVNGIILFFLWKHVRNPFVGIFVYFSISCIYFNIEIMKESMAVCAFLLNYKNLMEKKWCKYYFLALLTGLVHFSGLFTLFVPLFYTVFSSRKRIIPFIILYFVVAKIVVTFVFNYFPIEFIAARSGAYLGREDEMTLNYYIFNIVAYGLLPLLVLSFYKFHSSLCEKEIEPFIYIYILMGLSCFIIPSVFDRIENYFSIIFVVYLSNFFTDSFKKDKLKYVMVLLLFLIVYSFNNLKHHTFVCYYPYSSVFDKTIYPEREK